MWHENRGDNATYGNLIMAFEQAEYRNYADSVKKLASNIPSTYVVHEHRVSFLIQKCVLQHTWPCVDIVHNIIKFYMFLYAVGNATDPRPSGDGDALLQGPCGKCLNAS